MEKVIVFLKKLFGLRTFKTFLSVLISSIIMQYIFKQSPFFACIGAVVAMEKSMTESLRAALLRNVATLVGAAVGIAISSFTHNIFLLSLGTIPLIWISRALKKPESIVPGAIVYFAVVYLNTLEQAWVYGLTRFLGTLLGTLVALAVNFLIFPPKNYTIAQEQPLQPTIDG